ncbi:hypothetical protein, partial [Lapidilactobacillus luobeiensis]|uniref:hypothetical protein n=1 Tax=Lapidilactobacillus luobeiensis TaxID=2950371 RepID=UPI0021C44F43
GTDVYINLTPNRTVEVAVKMQKHSEFTRQTQRRPRPMLERNRRLHQSHPKPHSGSGGQNAEAQ